MLRSNEISAPTSTVCGCGLIKDCIFGASSSSTSSSQTNSPSKKSKRPNGHIKDKSTIPSQQRKKNKIDKANRSHSTSGGNDDSNVGMLSPVSSKNSQDESVDSSSKNNENNVPSPEKLHEQQQQVSFKFNFESFFFHFFHLI